MAIDNKEIVGTQETYVSYPDAQTVINPTMDYSTVTNKASDKSVKSQSLSHSTTLEIEELHGTKTCPSENLFNQPATFMTGDKKQTPGSQEIHDSIQNDQDTESLSSAQNTDKSFDSSIGIQEIFNTIEKPSITSAAKNIPNTSMSANEAVETQETIESKRMSSSVHNAQDVLSPSPTTLYDKESHDSKAHLSNNSLNQPTSFTIDDNKPRTQETHSTTQTDRVTENITIRITEQLHDSFLGSQEKSDTFHKPSCSSTQTAQNSAIIPDEAAIYQLPLKAPEPMTSSTQESDGYNEEKWFVYISKQNLPYLEAGLKRHPHVLNWFNTKRRRAFAALFNEVTSILRTTRRCDLTEGDRKYIKECCAALEAVGFDASWLSYVHGCIERCNDGDEVKRKLEETETKVFTLRNELVSAEASLVSLQEEASRLRNFIES